MSDAGSADGNLRGKALNLSQYALYCKIKLKFFLLCSGLNS